MTRFGPDPHGFFTEVYRNAAPWDVGSAQPAMAELLADYPPSGRVLDVGCGTGDLALHLAKQGYEVVGVDFVESAIAEARERAAALPEDVQALVRFEVADALAPSALGTDFGAVVDSGFLHLLDEEQSDRFVADLAGALVPGGRYYLHEFAVEFPIENVPRAVTAEEVRTRFTEASGWRVLDVRNAEFLSSVAAPVAATAACVERLGG